MINFLYCWCVLYFFARCCWEGNLATILQSIVKKVVLCCCHQRDSCARRTPVECRVSSLDWPFMRPLKLCSRHACLFVHTPHSLIFGEFNPTFFEIVFFLMRVQFLKNLTAEAPLSLALLITVYTQYQGCIRGFGAPCTCHLLSSLGWLILMVHRMLPHNTQA